MLVCRKCGTENAEGDKVCAVCGALLDEGAGRREQPRAKKRIAPKWFLLGGATLAVLILLVVLLVRCSSKKQAKPDVGLLALTKEYMRYSLSDGNADGSYPPVGLMDSAGKTLTDAAYQSVIGEVADDRFAVIGTNAKIGLIDRKGKEIIPPKYRDADLTVGYADGLWAVQNGDVWGYVDKKGNEKIACRYENAQGFSEGLAAVSDGRFWGYIDEDGKSVIDCRFDEAYLFDDGLACVCVDGKYGFIDKTGEFAIEPQFTKAYPYFEDGLCLICYGNRYGFIDKTGDFVINPQFDDALPFSEGLAAVKLEDKIGYVDKTGKYIIKPVYEGTLTKESLFYDGYAVVNDGEFALLIDKKGNKAVGTSFACTEISHLHDGFVLVCADGKYGLLDPKKGAYLKEPTYETLLFSLRDAAVFAGAKEGVSVLVGKDGEVIGELGSVVEEVPFLSNISKNVRALSRWLER